MSARIVKEIRLLLPMSLGSAILLILIAGFLGASGSEGSVITLSFIICCAILGIVSFGRDVTGNTLSQMFSQPVPRALLWREKVIVSGIVLLSMVVLFHILVFPEIKTATSRFVNDIPYFSRGYFMIGVVLPFFAYCVGPLLVILTRQVNASFCFLIVLGFVLIGTVAFISDLLRMNRYLLLMFQIAFVSVSIASFVLARKKFLVYEDSSSLSREISIPFHRLFSWTRNKDRARTLPSNPAWNLIKKELQLQQINFVFVLGFYAIMFVSLIILSSGTVNDEGTEAYFNNLKESLATGIRLAAAFFPFIIGAVAIAEERRYGVEEWHLLLPVSRFKQWCIKLLTCLVIALALGNGFMFVIDGLAYYFPEAIVLHGFGQLWKTSSLMEFGFYYAMLPVIGISVGLLASSLAKNYLQAISLQIILVAVFLVLRALAIKIINDPFFVFSNSPAILPFSPSIISLVILLGLSLWLSFRNSSYLETSGGRMKRTCLVLFLGWLLTVFATVCCYVIWELGRSLTSFLESAL